MEDILKYLHFDKWPEWLIVAAIVYYFSHKKIGELFFTTFPGMANKHLGAIANDRADKREHSQDQSERLLKEQLAASEAQRMAMVKREAKNAEILDRLVNILEYSLMQRLDQSDKTIVNELTSQKEVIVSELVGLRQAIDKLASRVGSKKTKTQTMLLNRIEGKGD